jgi:hypothetical protein
MTHTHVRYIAICFALILITPAYALVSSSIALPDDGKVTSITPEITFYIVSEDESPLFYQMYVDNALVNVSGNTTNNTLTTVTLPPLSTGVHTYVVEATDGAGNAANSTSRTVIVDTSLPSSSISAPQITALCST